MTARPLTRLLAVVALLAAPGCSTETAQQDRDGTSIGSPAESATTTAAGPRRQAEDPQCRGQGTTDTPEQAYREIDGVDPHSVSLDLFAPVVADGCAPTPIVVHVHGGGFRNGDKGNNVNDKVTLFNEAGWVFVSVNYRLVGDPAAGPSGAAYPIQAEDIAAAVGWVADHADDFGGDPEKIALMGHSAGAFLVAQQGTDPTYLAAEGVDPEVLRCVVPLDTETFAIADQISGGRPQEAVFRETFGDDPAVWERASPLSGAEAGTVSADFLMVSRGAAARTAGNERFAETLQAAGVGTTVINGGPLSHSGVNAAVGARDEKIVTPPLMAFLRDCFA